MKDVIGSSQIKLSVNVLKLGIRDPLGESGKIVTLPPRVDQIYLKMVGNCRSDSHAIFF